MITQFQMKFVAGRHLAYASNDTARELMRLTRRPTLTLDDLKLLVSLGVSVELVQEIVTIESLTAKGSKL